MLYLLGLLAVGYGGVMGYLYLNQRHLIYHPDTQIGEPAAYGLAGFEERFIRKDSAALQLWYKPAEGTMPVVVYFHGNAMHLGNRAGIYGALAARGFGVLALSYRGYGKSTGVPDEQGLYADARSALAYLAEDLKTPLAKTIVFGESLGTGVAVQMASEYPVAGLVLQAAYISVAQRAAEMYPYIPVKWLIKDSYHSLSKIGGVKAPLLLFHGHLDDTIPLAHGKAVFDAATSLKQAIFFPEKNHNDFDSAVISEHVLAFAKAHRII